MSIFRKFFTFSLFALSVLAGPAKSFAVDIFKIYKNPNSQSRAYVYGSQKKSAQVFLFIHGLAMDQTQFQKQIKYTRNLGLNAIALSLSGHGEDSNSQEKVSAVSWIQDINFAVEVARNYGDEIVVAGHSTGGMLAILAALFADDIKGLILIEPAIQVSLLSRAGSCFLSKVGVTSTAKVAEISRQFGLLKTTFREGSPSVSTHMGCEVHNLRAAAVRMLGLTPEEASDVPAAIAQRLNIPVVLYNNPDDVIVDSAQNRKFCKLMRNKGLGVCQKVSKGLVHGQAFEDDEMNFSINRSLRALEAKLNPALSPIRSALLTTD